MRPHSGAVIDVEDDVGVQGDEKPVEPIQPEQPFRILLRFRRNVPPAREV
jgi:hypothetical protein